MILVRQDQLQIVDPESPIMRTQLLPFDFSQHTSDDVEKLAKVMANKMVELGGIGLSANQVGLPYRMFVMGTDDNYLAVFNPEIVETFGEADTFKEGCLSYPGLFMYIKRPPSIRVRYQNTKGELREVDFSGLSARIFQHEYEHMSGRDFTVGASKLKIKMALDRYAKKKKQLIRKHAIETLKKAHEDGQKHTS